MEQPCQKITLAEGIPDSYRTVFMFLLRHPGSSQRNIAEFAGVTTPAVNQVVKSMLEEDYLRKNLFAKIMHLSFQQTGKISTSSLVTRLTNDVTLVQHEQLLAKQGKYYELYMTQFAGNKT